MTATVSDRLGEAYQVFVEREDLSAFESLLDPNVEWRAWNDQGNCHSREEAMATVWDALNRGVALRMPEFIGSGDTFVLVPHMDQLPPFLPPKAEGLLQVIESRDGKIFRIRDFIRRDAALAAAGLS